MNQVSLITLALAAAFVALPVTVQADNVTISNIQPRRDVHGNIMDAHDGNILFIDGLYYFFGMSYGTCKEPTGDGCSHQGGDPNCGFRTDHNVTVWTSPNLASSSWQLVGNALPPDGGRPEAIYYRPKIKFNPTTNLYVLWINGVPAGDFSQSFYLVATSPKPEGPFAVRNTNVSMHNPAPGDFDLFVDIDNKTAYLIYTTVSQGHLMSVEKLSDDWLSSTKQSSGFFGAQFVEAPAMFYRKGFYYTMFGHCCCFCKAGSGEGVYVSKAPLGPYTSLGNIGCEEDNAARGHSPYHVYAAKGGYEATSKGAVCTSITHSQQNCVFPVQTSSGIQLVWTGDRWQSAPDGIKAHDMQIWEPLVFNDDVKSGAPTIQKLKTLSEIPQFTLDLA